MNPTDRIVHVRLLGSVDAVERVARRLRDLLPVAEESRNYANHRDADVRRYLTVLLPEEDDR